jgi:hypothetical protein
MRSATRIVASTFGVVVGLAGLEHGIGEILQGNVAPAGLMFESWPHSALLRIMAGEPAMSVFPSLLLSGILTVLLSLAMIVWSAAFLGRRHAGFVLMLLSVLLLLTGGGIAPPLMGLMVGGAATRIRNPLTRWRASQRRTQPPLLGRLWRYLLIVSVLGYLALLPGLPLMSQFIQIEDPAIVVYLALFSLSTLVLALLASLVWDSYQSGRADLEVAR